MGRENVLDPVLPMILLFEVTFTLTAPVKLPLTRITALPSAWTAAVKAARLETVVVVPPEPPVVLRLLAVSKGCFSLGVSSREKDE
jgi:hypothetical protein